MEAFVPFADKAPMMLGIVWTMQFIAFVLVGLRLYTRLVVIHNYGIDDHFFNFAVFFLLVYVILITVAARYGLGQEMKEPSSSFTKRALLLVNIAQTVTSAAVISVKISIACFLLRIVGAYTAHQVAIIVPVTLMSLGLFVATWLLWFSCKPVSYSWDITVQGGHCDGVTQFWAGLVSGGLIVLVELWYASFPWYLIKGLQMPRREKILIGTSMSISYISAACSISRLVTLLQLAHASDDDFLLTIVQVLIWHAADITSQLFCVGVTVCRPLYKGWLYRVADHMESHSAAAKDSHWPTGDEKNKPDRDAAAPWLGGGAGGHEFEFESVALRTIGGTEVEPPPPKYQYQHDHKRPSVASAGSTRGSRRPGDAIRRSLVFIEDDAVGGDDLELTDIGGLLGDGARGGVAARKG